MDRRHCNRKPPPPASSVDSEEDGEKKESSLLPVIDMTSMLDDSNGDVENGDVSSEGENGKIQSIRGRKRHMQSKRSIISSSRKKSNNLKTTSLKKPPPQLPDPNPSSILFPATAVSPDCTSMSASSSASSSSTSSSPSPCCKNNTGDALPSLTTMEISTPTMGKKKKKKKNNRKTDAKPANGETDDIDDEDDDGYDSWGKGSWCFLLPNSNGKDVAGTTTTTTTATTISSNCKVVKMESSMNNEDKKKPTPDLQPTGNDNNATSITVEAINEVMKDDEQDAKVKNRKNDDDDDDDDDDGYSSWGKGNWCFVLPNNDTYHPTTTATIISINSSIVRMKISTNNDDGEDNKKPTPDPQTSRSNSSNATTSITMKAIEKLMKGDEQDVKVKKEGTANGLSKKEREKRKSNFKIWKKANTDPDDGLGRYVFRRGCHSKCITTILGGSGCLPFPVVAFLQNPTMQNPFIEPGEYYVAGNEGWNPFGPRFPGDTGSVDTRSFGQNPQQEEFHLFVQCASQSHKRLWHGKNARDGRLYVGVYKRQPDDGPYCEEKIYFKSDRLLESNKMTIAKFRAEKSETYKDAEDYPDATKKKAVKAFIDQMDEVGTMDTGTAQFQLKSESEKKALYMYQWLIEMNYNLDFTPVVFVRYDEDLYRSLKESGSAMIRSDRTGRVSLEPDVLQQYY